MDDERDTVGITPLPPVGISVSLWWCDLDARATAIERYAHWLSPGEAARADRFGTEVLRLRFMAGRSALRWILGQHLRTEPSEVSLQPGPRGRPELAGENMPDFNVSHTRGVALIGIADAGPRRIGVDLERLDRAVGADRLARKFLTPNERRVEARWPAGERARRFLRYWTCKEAMSKATGDALSAPFAALEVQLGTPPRFVAGPPPYEPAAWLLHSAGVPEAYVGTVAVWTTAGA